MARENQQQLVVYCWKLVVKAIEIICAEVIGLAVG